MSGFVEKNFDQELFERLLQSVHINAYYISHLEIPFETANGVASYIGRLRNESTKIVTGFRRFLLKYHKEDRVEENH